MSQIQYLKILLILLFLTMLSAKAVAPIQLNSEEVLTIYGNDRSYHQLVKDSLTYYVQGPKIIHIYSRLAFPGLTKKIKPYKFKVVVDELDSFVVSHHFKKDPNVFSKMHPRHSYTNSGLDVINIPKGTHRIDIIPLEKKSNINIRLNAKSFKKFDDDKSSNIIIENSSSSDKILKIGNKNIKYFSIRARSMNDKIFFNAKGPSTIKITSRTTFYNEEKRDYYQFKIRRNNKLISTHHMFSDISKGTSMRKSDLGVSKFKTTFISVPDSDNQYEIEAIYPQDKEVLFKLVQSK